MEFLHEGSPTTIIDEARGEQHVTSLLAQLRQRGPLNRVLIIPPDLSRSESWAGTLTCMLYRQLHPATEVHILPAVGSHHPMDEEGLAEMFPGVPAQHFHAHNWRNTIAPLGEVPASFIRDISEGVLDFPVRVEVNRLLVEQTWDAILSVGQLVPHEVIGIANHAKNLFVGAGGFDLINRSHWLGAVYGIERILGRTMTPVRRMLNYAAEQLAGHLPLVYLLTVRAADDSGQLVTRGLYAGDDLACFRRGAELSRQVNLNRLERSPKKVVTYLPPREFQSTWLGNKAVYRTRMAIADAGELIVLAPGVREFGEDATIDRLIRKYGYRGTPSTLRAVEQDPELQNNLSAAAHLIHGSSEGRFTITYCPGQLTREEIEEVGFGHADLAAMLQRYPPDRLQEGWNTLPDGEEVYYISNPALGLWWSGERFGSLD
jgi:nickel-dependent lactate racemase